jgi:hypothetical protein
MNISLDLLQIKLNLKLYKSLSSINANGGLSIMLTKGRDNLTTGITGILEKVM